MENPRILIDTSIIIEHLRKQNRLTLNTGHLGRVERLQLRSPQ